LALLVKNLLANAGDIRDAGLIPGSGRFLGEGHGNSLQYSCLENPMDRGAPQVGYSPQGHKESDMTEVSSHTHTHMHTICINPIGIRNQKAYNRFTNTREKGTQAYHLIKL